jgi:flagellar motor switch/type III secretory pathway protein FliN
MLTSMSPEPNSAPEAIDEYQDVLITLEARLEDRLMDLQGIAKIDVGSVIPLFRAAGETLDVYVGNVRFATAEVVLIEDMLAVRITELDGVKP